MTTPTTTPSAAAETGYAPVNGLRMYYEIHGANQARTPLVLLHGGFMTIEALGPLLPALAETRQVIVPEMQAHGRTADVDRPLTYEQMADDTAALLQHIGVEQADVAGYSLGGGVAWQLAIRRPELVRKLVPISIATNTADGVVPEYHAALASLTPELFEGSPGRKPTTGSRRTRGPFPPSSRRSKDSTPNPTPGRRSPFGASQRRPCSSSGTPKASTSDTRPSCSTCAAAAASATSPASRRPGSRCFRAQRTSASWSASTGCGR